MLTETRSHELAPRGSLRAHRNPPARVAARHIARTRQAYLYICTLMTAGIADVSRAARGQHGAHAAAHAHADAPPLSAVSPSCVDSRRHEPTASPLSLDRASVRVRGSSLHVMARAGCSVLLPLAVVDCKSIGGRKGKRLGRPVLGEHLRERRSERAPGA